jgi:hypothetical protein
MRNLTARVHKIRVLSKRKPTLKRQILFSTRIKPRPFHIIYTGQSFLTSSAMGIQMGEMPSLGRLIRYATTDTWADSLFPVGGVRSNTFPGLLCMCVGLILIFRADSGSHSCSLMCTSKRLIVSPTPPVCISTDRPWFSSPGGCCILHMHTHDSCYHLGLFFAGYCLQLKQRP